MIDLTTGVARDCEGVSRRSFLKIGALSFLGIEMADLFRMQAAIAAEGGARDTACIFIYCGGGPTHIDMWDLKPDAPAEIRGEFKPIRTNVAGIDICEHLPLSARQMDKFSILRSVTHTQGSHGPATHYMQTGLNPSRGFAGGTAINEHPSVGSFVAAERGAKNGLPPYMAVPRFLNSGGAGFLGASAAPFVIDSDPNAPDFRVRDVTAPRLVTAARVQDRRAILQKLDRFERAHQQSAEDPVRGMDTFYEKAYNLITSPQARKAFDLEAEPAALRDRYGRTTFGQSCLLARRLVEAGVRFVSVSVGGWDNHANLFREMEEQQFPVFDPTWSALVQDLRDRGLMEKVLVVVSGEFGRTPRINNGGGRDHWPNCMSLVLAGGGLRMGQVVGESDANGEFPKVRPIRPEDVMATMYRVLGVDYNKEYHTPLGRPVKILPNPGEPIHELL